MSVFTDAFEPYGAGRLAPRNSLAPADLHAKLLRYKRTVAKRYRIVLPELLEKRLPEAPFWLSPKVDGQLWFLIKHEGEVALCAYNGRVLQGTPLVDEAEKLLERAPSLIMPGELFAVPPKGEGRPRVGRVGKALADASLAPSLGFKAFDLFEFDGEDWLAKPYGERLAKMQTLLDGGRRASVITTIEGDRDAVRSYFHEWVGSSKFEGVVARSEHGVTYKIKPSLSLDAVVVAYGESRDKDTSSMRELTVALLRDDGASFQILGSVGGGFSDMDRVAWLHRLQAMQMPSAFRLANREGTLCHFVRPEIVIELKCSDLMDTDSSDLPVRRMVLSHDPEVGYDALNAMPIPSLIHPVFVRERDDKRVDVGSVGLDQVFQYMPFDARDESPRQSALPASDVLRREVYTKTTKGNVAVRKLVVIATNKVEADRRYPPYVVHFTDYSPTRQDPLKTALKVGSTLEAMDGHVEEWLEANIKKGWELQAER